MLQVENFKKISVKDIRKIIKELDLKKKKKELKGYSYRKKKELIAMLLDMDIPMSVLDKYRKVKGAKAKSTKAKAKAPVKKNIEIEIKEKPKNESMFNIMEVVGGQVKNVGNYNDKQEAINNFNKMIEMNKKVYLIKQNEILRSYVKPRVRMEANGRFKAHVMYKGKKKVVADTKAEHMKLKQIGYTHKADDKPMNSPKAKMKAQMNAIEPSGY